MEAPGNVDASLFPLSTLLDSEQLKIRRSESSIGAEGREYIEFSDALQFGRLTQRFPAAIRRLNLWGDEPVDKKSNTTRFILSEGLDQRVAFLKRRIRTTLGFRMTNVSGKGKNILEVSITEDPDGDLLKYLEHDRNTALVMLEYQEGKLIRCILQNETPKQEKEEDVLDWRESLPRLKGYVEDTEPKIQHLHLMDCRQTLDSYRNSNVSLYNGVEIWATTVQAQMLTEIPPDDREEYTQLFRNMGLRDELIWEVFDESNRLGELPDINNIEKRDAIVNKRIKFLIALYRNVDATDERQILELTNLSAEGFDWAEIATDATKFKAIRKPDELDLSRKLMNEGHFTYGKSEPTIRLQDGSFMIMRNAPLEPGDSEGIQIMHRIGHGDKERSWISGFKLTIPQAEITTIYTDPKANFQRIPQLLRAVFAN